MNSPLYQDLIEKIFQRSSEVSPLLVGVTGAMGVGKSTFSKQLQQTLQSRFQDKRVSLIHTDGFIYPNEVLRKRSLMETKGFPESFDNVSYLQFIAALKADEYTLYSLPSYSQVYKDIDPEASQKIPQSDIYLIEGINLFFPLIKDSQLNIHTLYDEIIFLLMPSDEVWAQNSKRFNEALKQAKTSKTEYFESLLKLSEQEIRDYEERLRTHIHEPFWKEFLDPYKDLATFQIPLVHEDPFKGVLLF